MVCQECKERPATLHFTKIINGEKTEIHLCEKCAQENSNFSSINNNAGFTIHNLLSGFLNNNNMEINPVFQEKQVTKCEKCNLTFAQFQKVGRFGCSNCYKTFADQIHPMLRRVHSGNTVHAGKLPKRLGGNLKLKKQLTSLKEQLKQLISTEQFEKASEVRDEIRSLEARMNKGEY
ncbi:UvrB/UvrC motif-containing protein [Bacillus carboniphilus]|uniref:UvrB/UvrC motif-containing protein n=1 Tax=Bacillus carboniphilus TaxID=86663 RepID=A0ABY9JU50_9BACI|nr:UvrB/UvrC motif-containing protein [Bacillus carboniphilus]WLR41955.1 UvrB/UvrC motif-containing protein [Bacillus carboniphilus]